MSNCAIHCFIAGFNLNFVVVRQKRAVNDEAESSSIPLDDKMVSIATNLSEFTLSNLLPNSVYLITITAFTVAGPGPPYQLTVNTCKYHIYFST